VIPPNGRKSGEPFAAVPIVAVVILAAILLTIGFHRLADSLGPRTGDIISFPGTRVASISRALITVSPLGAPGGRACILDLPVMQKSGGSLVIEAMRSEPDRIFQVHWTGVRTSDGPGDCGGSVDLLLNSAQIAALAFASGGTGVNARN
jgi:hypothetical protein